MPFYVNPSDSDINTIAYLGLADNYLTELATQIGRDKEKINSDVIRKSLHLSLDGNIYTQVFYDELNTPRAVFGLSHGGAVSYVETKGLQPIQRAKWARASKDLFIHLRHATGLVPWCYSDSRNTKASRLLEWFKFKHIKEKDISISGVVFYYYEHQLPVAE